MKKFVWSLIPLFFFAHSYARAQLTVSAGATLNLSAQSRLNIQDLDLTIDGAINAGAASVVRLSGSESTGIGGSSSILLAEMIIDKDGGHKVMLDQDVEVKEEVTLISGLLDLHHHRLVLQSGATLSGESTVNYVTGTSGGYIETTVSLNAPAAAAPGNLGVVLTSDADLGETIVRRGHVAQVYGSFTGINRYFDILPENNLNLNATARFYYLDPELNGIPEEELVLGRSTDFTNWVNESAGTVSNTSDNYLEKTGISQFSRWTMFGAGALPVQLVYFKGSLHEQGVGALTWATVSEERFSHFEVQASTDAKNFSVLGSVSKGLPAGGHMLYHFTDSRGAAGTLYYRLRMIDLDGSFDYSNLVRIVYKPSPPILAYPNPVSANLHLVAGKPIEHVEISDMRGVILEKFSGRNLDTVFMESYPSGIYLIKVNGRDVLKVLKK
ncbi:MAG: hypothetical protein ABS46_00075 [Cytophagaceae bacterium SCN 52-12]|nr:MAG: hypothetical protein ABS46_00075 [Cytophagaceae bacterium SCN 52-12]